MTQDVHDALENWFAQYEIERQLHDVPPHAVYAVTVDGRRAVCKVARGETADVGAEAAAMAHADRHTDLPVPSVLAARECAFVATWLDGLGGRVDPEDPADARALGRGLARLHTATANAVPRPGFPELGPAWGPDGHAVSERDDDSRVLAVDGRDVVAAALDRETKVCMGVGMTGAPHLGTVGQILTGVEFQEAGLDVQLVVADLEPYHGGADLKRVRALAERYREFALDPGFDPKQGVLRTQAEGLDVMHTAELLAPYHAPERWGEDGDGDEGGGTAWERAVREVYENGEVDPRQEGPTSEAASAHSSVLHGADFLHPLYAEGYEQVIVALGVDEHDLTPWSRQFRDAAPVDGRIAGLHTRMVPGFGDTPKMSKSVGAGVSLDMKPGTIRERFADAGDGGDPESSATFQAMCLASRYGSGELERLERLCVERGERWVDARREYAECVVELAEQWQSTA
jgi:tryptophanyl-tRNA synthetase